MKKLAAFIFALLISLSFHADARLVSGTAQHQHDSATGGGNTINSTIINAATITNAASINVDGSVTSDKSCASGYTRITPNFCLRTGGIIDVASTTYTTACNITNSLVGVTTATAVVISATTAPFSGNAAGFERIQRLNLFLDTDTSCSTVLYNTETSAIEEVACLNCRMDIGRPTIIVKTNSTGQYRYTYSASHGSNVDHIVIGYYD